MTNEQLLAKAAAAQSEFWEALYAMLSTRDPLDPKMVERIKELPGVDSVCSPHGRYSLMLYKGRLFRWEEIQDSIYALFSDNEVTK